MRVRITALLKRPTRTYTEIHVGADLCSWGGPPEPCFSPKKSEVIACWGFNKVTTIIINSLTRTLKWITYSIHGTQPCSYHANTIYSHVNIANTPALVRKLARRNRRDPRTSLRTKRAIDAVLPNVGRSGGIDRGVRNTPPGLQTGDKQRHHSPTPPGLYLFKSVWEKGGPMICN